MSTTPTTVEELLDYWPGNIPFKNALVSEDGCMCAQGQALHFLRQVPIEILRRYDPDVADREAAEIFGISVSHSILLRFINDSYPGAPSVVIKKPAKVLGDQAETILAFWHHLDSMTTAQWFDVGVRRQSLSKAQGILAGQDAGDAAINAVGREMAEAGWGCTRHAPSNVCSFLPSASASSAVHEIQGAAVLRKRGIPFIFLPMFGFTSPEDVLKHHHHTIASES